MAEQRHGRCVHIHADSIHAVLDDAVQSSIQLRRLQIMLILTHTDGFGIDLDQLRQRILQAPGDGYRTAQVDVKVRELLRSQLGSGIHRRTGLADNHICKTIAHVHFLHDLHEELLGFPAGCTVADGSNGYTMLANETLDGFLCRLHSRSTLEHRVDDRRVQHAARLIHHGDLAAMGIARIETDGGTPLDRRRHQEGLEVQREYADGRCLRLVRQFSAQLRVQGRRDQPGVGVITGTGHIYTGRGAIAAHIACADDGLRCGNIDLQRDLDRAFLLRTVHGQHTVARHQPQRFTVVIVHAVGAVFIRFILSSTGSYLALPVIICLQPGADASIVTDRLSNDIHRALQGLLCRGHAFFLVYILGRHLLRCSHTGRLHHQHIGQRLQTALLGNGGTGAALGTIRTINVFQLSQRGRIVQRDLQLLRPDLQLLEGLADFIPALLDVAKGIQSVRDVAQLLVIQGTVLLLAITCNERQRRPFIQQGDNRLHLPGLNAELLAKCFNNGQIVLPPNA